MPLTPKERYQSDLSSGVILPDEAQAQAVDALQDVLSVSICVYRKIIPYQAAG